MICRSADPVHDAWKQDDLDHEQLEKCPVCDGCGGRITSRTYTEVVYKWRIYRFCEECASVQLTSDYITEMEEYGNAL